tara:strand:- start:2190 stop:2945 length:756 start_codon:yes stop_codon:yes gene_type:complete
MINQFEEAFKLNPVAKRCKQCDKPFNAPHSKVTLCSEACKAEVCNEVNEQIAKDRFLHCQSEFPRVHKGANIVDFHISGLNGRKELMLAIAGENPVNAVEVAQKYVFGDIWGLFLSSPQSGIGKTRLGLVVLAEMARKGVRPSASLVGNGYFKAIDIAKIMESERFDTKKKLTSALSYSDILMIDELGFENDKQSQEISALIQEREENQLRTIITTNLDYRMIMEKYGQKMLSRIEGVLYSCTGENWRMRG